MFWLRAARAPFFTGSLGPVLVGTAAAFHDTATVNWLHAGLALAALVCLHAGANLANDYFDHLSGNDEINTTYVSPFTGGSRVIQRGEASCGEVLTAALISFGLGGALGGYLVHATGWPVLALGAVGAATGFFYTAPPLKLGYRGLGELFIFLDFGLLPVLGAYWVQAQRLSAGAAVGGAAVGFLITNILWINQFQDLEADAAVGKRHWVVRLGRRRSAWVHAGLFGASYLALVLGAMAGLLPPGALLALGGLPLAARAAAFSRRHHDDLPRLTPANALTITTHLVTCVLLAGGLAVARVA